MSRNENSRSESYPPSRILVPIDGSPNAKRALDLGIKLAEKFDAELIVLNVLPINSHRDSYYEQQEKEGSQLVEQAVTIAKTQDLSKVRTEVTRAADSVVEEIIDTARHNNIDLVVIGTRGLGGFKKLLLGSVSSGVVSHADCNVLVVR